MIEHRKLLLKAGVDALDFLKTVDRRLLKKVDTVVWDPPYLDSGNEKDVERVNARSKLKDRRVNLARQYTRLMSRTHRDTVYGFIRTHCPRARFIHFHSIESRLPDDAICTHVWVKPTNISMAGNSDRNNGEYIAVTGPPIRGLLSGRILNKFIAVDAEYKPNARGGPTIVRACAKPRKLYSELFRHLDSKIVLDVFAGHGASISAAVERGAQMIACDIDPTVEKSGHWHPVFLEDFLGVEA